MHHPISTILMRSLALFVLALFASAQSSHDVITSSTSFLPADHPAIQYSQAQINDPVTSLEKRIQSGKARLEFKADGLGYLPSLLENLGVNPDSQMLVFSKTSFQAPKISPSNPRALYFSDSVQVGFVRGGDVMEIIALDPKQGDIFYTLDTKKADQPTFDRRGVACLQCHMGPATLGVPGIMVASVYPDASGMPVLRLGEPVTDQRTPFGDRWGGWYVNGTHGKQFHRGNAVLRGGMLDFGESQNLTTSAGRFDPRGYLSAVSDIVALMTLEHQTRMTDLLVRLGWEDRIAEFDGKPSPQLDADLQAAVVYMLFADEAPLREPVKGVSGFTKTFAQPGPSDKKGRSLRDFDLQKRLFRYPLSYMIYSPAFEGLPSHVRERIYRCVYDVLSGKNQGPEFARLSADDRQAVLEIVRDTVPDLPAYWRAGPAVGAGSR
jgi:hypothetical protein